MAYALAARMPAAWNAKDAMRRQAIVFVPDLYATFTPHPQLPSQIFRPGAGVVTTTGSGNHGFHVCGTLGATFDNKLPTGALPVSIGRIQIYSLPMQGLSWLDMLKEIADWMPGRDRFVMNTSLGYNDATFEFQSKVTRALHAMYWRARVASENSRFFHAAAAGNDGRTTGDGGESRFATPFVASRMFSDLRDMVAGESLSEADSIAVESSWQLLIQGGVQAAPQNVMVVGSSDTLGVESDFSSRGFDVRAIGEHVWSSCSLAISGGTGSCDGSIARLNGTSMASPQIAGLAAYMWAIDPNLSVAQTIDRIRNAYNNSNTPGTTDTYLGMLSVDRSLAEAAVRKGILDVAGNSDAPGFNEKFDDHDLKVYVDMFDTASGTLDYSRYDLNGDGETGGGSTTPMDLTVDSPPQFRQASLTIEGRPALLDENAVSDLEALCYYAYSSLYTGDTARRAEILADCLALTNEPGGTAVITSAPHSMSGDALTAMIESICGDLTPCRMTDDYQQDSGDFNYNNMGNVSATCMGATANAQATADGQTNVDPSNGVFTTIDVTMSSSAEISGGGGYAANGGMSSSVNWRFQVKDADIPFRFSGNGATSGWVYLANVYIQARIIIENSGGGAIGTVHNFTFGNRNDSLSWDETGVLEPGYYRLEGIVSTSGTPDDPCGNGSLMLKSDLTFTLDLSP